MDEQPSENRTTETVALPTGGSIPGIPGSHGPGTYLIDWLARTITPVVQAVEAEIARVEEAIHPSAEPAPADPSPVETLSPGEDASAETLEQVSEQVNQEP
jgi:hypothetical protein